MAGYDGFSKSNNALDAEAQGLLPASILAKQMRLPVAVIIEAGASEWHHTSSWFNRTDYYSRADVEEFLATDEGQEALASARRPRQVVRHENCRVAWLEWVGTTRRSRRPVEHRVDGCVVVEKGLSATVTLPDGQTFRKLQKTHGFWYHTLKHTAEAV